MERKTKRLSPKLITKDQDVLKVLTEMDGYKPNRNEFSVESLLALSNDLAKKKQARLKLEGEVKGARDNEVLAEHAFHDAISEAKGQVRSLFGDNSNELQSIGLKKKTERKAPKRKTAK